MTGRSILGLCTGAEPAGKRQTVFVERERHANVRRSDLSYPIRAIRTREFLYIRNFRPELWPAGDPQKWKAVGPFGDCDDGLTKQYILAHRDDPAVRPLFDLCFAKRPAEELYDVQADPNEIHNLAASRLLPPSKKASAAELDRWMRDTADQRNESNRRPLGQISLLRQMK